MAETNTFLSDPRRRNLAMLAAATLVMVLIAIIAVRQEAAEMAPKYSPETFFPGLAGQIRDAARIHIESRKGAFDVVSVPGRGWVLPGRNSYPASLDEIRQTLVGFAALETIEPKTSQPGWFRYVDLDPPPRGNGTLIRIFDAQNRELAGVIIGKSEDVGDPGGSIGLFVRKPDETQSYLALSPFSPKSDPADWMDKAVLDVDRARIQQVVVTPANGPAYLVRRDKPSDPDFTLLPIPKGRELADVASPDGVASAITGFTFDDVAPAASLDFSKSTHVVTTTFDGLTVTVNVIERGADTWATVSADAAAAAKDRVREATQINSRASGWAYKLPSYKGQQFMTTLESLLKPVAAPATTAP